MRKGFNFRDLDWLLLLISLAIAGVGIIEIYSTTMHTALADQYKKQIEWVFLGVFLALIVSQIDYYLIFGHPVAGTRRWLALGGLTFQVSEMAKLVIIMSVAAYLASRKSRSVTWQDLGALGLLAGIPAVLVALEPDLGTALTLFPAIAAGIFLAGIRLRQL